MFLAPDRGLLSSVLTPEIVTGTLLMADSTGIIILVRSPDSPVESSEMVFEAHLAATPLISRLLCSSFISAPNWIATDIADSMSLPISKPERLDLPLASEAAITDL